MIIIDHNNEIHQYLDAVNDGSLALIRLDADSFEIANGISDELVLIHSGAYAGFSRALKAKLNEQRGLIFYLEDSPLACENILFDFKASDDAQSVIQKLENLEEIFKENTILKSQLFSLNKEISTLIGSVETELLRVKKFYEFNTPRRFKDIKGLKIISKYAAGESIGGEFFDIFEGQNKVFLLMSDTSSYLASSSILSLFTAFKMENKINDDSNEKLVNEIKLEMQEISSNKKKELDVALLSIIIDLNTYEAEGYVFGDYRIMSSLKLDKLKGIDKNLVNSNVKEGKVSFKFDRAERALFLSPGFNRSWSTLKPDFMVEELLNKGSIKQLDILDEIFFQFKKDRPSGFLPYDASAIMMEVQKNVMLKV